MPRKRRNFEKGGVYHIIQRGVDRRKIFLSKKDYMRFLLALEFFNSEEDINLWRLFFRDGKNGAGYDSSELKRRIYEKRIFYKNKRKRKVGLLSFSLMPNHYHLLLRETRRGGISSYMQKMGGYAVYFNNEHKRSGALFQSRYTVVRAKDDRQLRAIFHYIHTNPIELWEPGWKEGRIKNYIEAVKNLCKYRYSSFLDYIGKRNLPHITRREFFLDFFGSKKVIREETERWIKEKKKLSL